MSSSRFLSLGLFLSVLMWAGCSRSVKSSSTDSAQEDPVPPDFRMVLGQGGGVTGQWSGFTIEADGSILQWSGPVAERNVRPAGTLNAEQSAAIWRDIIQSDFFSQEIDDRGEMTAFLRINADSTEHRASWVPGAEQLEPPKHPSEALYWRTRNVVLAAANAAGEGPVTK